MNKKIVVGSVLAVFVLVAISLTSVIGGVDSSESGSPLYIIRAERATIQEKTITTDGEYIAGEGDLLSVPQLDEELMTEEDSNAPVTAHDCKSVFPFIKWTCLLSTCGICRLDMAPENEQIFEYYQ